MWHQSWNFKDTPRILSWLSVRDAVLAAERYSAWCDALEMFCQLPVKKFCPNWLSWMSWLPVWRYCHCLDSLSGDAAVTAIQKILSWLPVWRCILIVCLEILTWFLFRNAVLIACVEILSLMVCLEMLPWWPVWTSDVFFFTSLLTNTKEEKNLLTNFWLVWDEV